LDIEDMPDFEIDEFFDKAHQLINEKMNKGEGVLVVCTAGISRSATIVISYLIKEKKMSYEEAFDLTKKARVFIKPNKGFEKILREYAAKVHCELCNLK
jgi:protein-tyrosine phosphatase